jgi:hypothetical protein
VRSDREALARTTGGTASLGGVGFPWLWSVLAWAALLVVIAVSFSSAVPVIWGDTPSFVESALRTLEAGRPTVAGGRDPGYPAFLAVTFAFGGGLRTAVYLQQAAWAVLMLALAATAQATTRNAGGLVPIILVATYPGLLLFRNVLTADLLFAVFLNLAMAGLLVATCLDKAARCYAVAASVLCAALAACFRSQGILVPIAAIVVGARLAWPDTTARLAVMTVSVAAALALLAAGSRFGASNSDQASTVFVPKTLFCNHLNIVLASDAARREIVSAAGNRTDATMARLAADFAAEPGRWPVLGFFGDACLFDTALDGDVAGRYRECCRRGCSLSADLPGSCARPAARLRGQVRPSDGLWRLGRMAALRTRPCHTGVDRRRATRVRRHDAARPGASADRSARRASSDRPTVRSPKHLRISVQGIIRRLRCRRYILDGDRCAASASRVLDARRYCDRDVGGSDRDRRRRPHPGRLAISDSRSADGGPPAVPFRRRTGRNDRMPTEGLIASLASSRAQKMRVHY